MRRLPLTLLRLVLVPVVVLPSGRSHPLHVSTAFHATRLRATDR